MTVLRAVLEFSFVMSSFAWFKGTDFSQMTILDTTCTGDNTTALAYLYNIKSTIFCSVLCTTNDECTCFFYDIDGGRCHLYSGLHCGFVGETKGSFKFYMDTSVLQKQQEKHDCKYASKQVNDLHFIHTFLHSEPLTYLYR